MSKTERKRKSRPGSKSQNNVPAFLLKTYEILENPAYQDIVSWNKEGNAFIVKKVTDFSEKILPKYFKHNNFASFVRQLNMYDFHKARNDNSENEFRHKMFKRNQKNLLSEIRRKTSEGGFTTQLVPYDKVFDIDKVKRECSTFTKDLSVIKTRQSELEKVTHVMFNQNNQLVKENKLLWNELIKSRDKYERKIEKLMMFIFSMIHGNGTPAISAFEDKKGILAENLPETLRGLTSEYEELKKESLNEDNTLQIISESQNKNEKTLKRLMKFFNSSNSENEYENNNFDILDKDINGENFDESEIIQTSKDINQEYFEQPKRKKGRPRKLKALMNSEDPIPAEEGNLKKFVKTVSNSEEPNMADYDELDKPLDSEKNEDLLSPRIDPLKLKRKISESELGTPKLGISSRFANNLYLDYDHSNPQISLRDDYQNSEERMHRNDQNEDQYTKIIDSPAYFGPEIFINNSPHPRTNNIVDDEWI